MRAYIFQAAMLCGDCSDHWRDCRPHDHDTGDSDDYPQGPYPNGGGEADCPQHCDHCGEFLENPLTDDGDEYVRRLAEEFEEAGADMTWNEIAEAADRGNQPVLADWVRFYFGWGI